MLKSQFQTYVFQVFPKCLQLILKITHFELSLTAFSNADIVFCCPFMTDACAIKMKNKSFIKTSIFAGFAKRTKVGKKGKTTCEKDGEKG